MIRKSNYISCRINKRAMDANQMFMYITVVVVVGFVFLFGFRAVGGLQKSISGVNDFQLQKEFTDKITQTRADHDSEQTYNYRIPSGTKQVCFLDLGQIRGSGPNQCGGLAQISKPLQQLCDDMAGDESFAPINVIHLNQDGSIGQNYHIEGIRLPIVNPQTNSYSGSFQPFACSGGNSISMFIHGLRREAFLVLRD
jgi:hypothetical protein